jgi:hypothetical protein
MNEQQMNSKIIFIRKDGTKVSEAVTQGLMAWIQKDGKTRTLNQKWLLLLEQARLYNFCIGWQRDDDSIEMVDMAHLLKNLDG